ncbi:T9SS type A sorting domain-containing protein [Soonwooa sp.]|uniref:T9SS type A sorting domain-containing protein n=1 Tax=Soonwooa sp. TaxID=1938592 RepID=UPI003917F10B
MYKKNKSVTYPNPVKDIVTINSASKIENFKIFDFTGKLVYSIDVNASKKEINLSKLQTGTYTVNIKSEDGIETTNIIKK